MSKKFISLSLLAALFIVICIPAQSAFATTQTLAVTGTWRTITSQEITGLSRGNYIGNSADATTHPELASAPSTGWTPSPDAISSAIPDANDHAAIILDLPKVNLSCSSNVQISITGLGDISSPDGFNAFVANQSSDLLVDSSAHPLALYSTQVSPTQESINGSIPVNPNSPAFGNKVILSAGVGDSNNPVSIDVHDVSVNYTYDDMGGTCSPTPAPAVATQCNDSYLDTHTQALDPATLTYFGGINGVDAENAIGDTSPVLTSAGYAFNPDLNEVADPQNDTERFLEVKISPQTILEGAGAVELRVNFNLDAVSSSESYMFGFFDPDDGSTPAWQAENQILNTTHEQSMTTYLNSSDLAIARIFIGIPTTDHGSNLSSKLSNVHVTVSHLDDVSVCGIQLTKSESTPGSAAAAGVSSLPVTGSSSDDLVTIGLLMCAAGFVLIRLSRRFTNTVPAAG